MSTYEPGRLYLIDLDGETHQATYRQGGRDNHAAVFLTYDGAVISALKAQNPRLAVALDPEDEAVQAFATGHGKVGHVGCCAVAAKIRAQITPPEPPMEEPTEWGAQVTDDRGDWLRAVMLSDFDTDFWAARVGGEWSSWDDMQNPRAYNPEED